MWFRTFIYCGEIFIKWLKAYFLNSINLLVPFNMYSCLVINVDNQGKTSWTLNNNNKKKFIMFEQRKKKLLVKKMPYLFYIQPLLVFIYFIVKAVITRLDTGVQVYLFYFFVWRTQKAARAQFTGFEDYLSSKKKIGLIEGKKKKKL